MSRQNSREVSSLEVTLNGSQVEIEPVGNGTMTIDDIKVLLLKGQTGSAGKGVVSIEKTSTSGLVDTYTITYTDGDTDTFTITNGNGIASVAKTGTSGLVDTYTITYTDGDTDTFTVTNGATYQVAEDFDATKAYYVGDCVCYNELLYRFTSDHPAGAWDANDVVETTVGDEIANYRRAIITVPTSAWSNTQTSGYYTATLTTPIFSTVFAPKASCSGASITSDPTSAQLSAYRNIQAPNGKIEQISSTSIKLYAKTKPTDEFYIMLSGYGIGVQIDTCQSATVAGSTQAAFTFSRSCDYQALNTYPFNGSMVRSLGFRRRIYAINSSNWSSSANSSGYYTYSLNTGSGEGNTFDSYYGTNISVSGSTYSSRPTSEQISNYRKICEPNGYVNQTASNAFTLYAKTKPTATFYILIEGNTFA